MKYVLFLSLSCIIGVAVVLSNHRAQHTEAELVRMKRALDGLQEQLANTNTTPVGATIVRVERATDNRAGSAENAPPATPPAPSPAAVAPVPPSFEDQQSHFESTFADQRSDADWSRKASVRLKDMIEPFTNRDTRLVSFDCRTTICRMELTHASDAAFHEFLTSNPTFNWGAPASGGRVRTDADGTVTSVIYLAKEGTQLPFLD